MLLKLAVLTLVAAAGLAQVPQEDAAEKRQPLNALGLDFELLSGHDGFGERGRLAPDVAQRIFREAEAGIAESQYTAGLLRLYGTDGVRQDPQSALALFTSAAAQGHIGAQTNAAILILRGIGTTARPESAARWFREAAEQNNADAQWMLGRMYYDGLVGVSPRGPDFAAAKEWFQRAADNGSAKGFFNLGLMTEYGLGGLRQDYGAARQAYDRAWRLGDKESAYYLGIMYLYGRGVQQDMKYAARLIRESAQAAIPEAMVTLGKLHTHGQGVELDYRLAVAWFGKAAGVASEGSTVQIEAEKARAELAGLLERADKQMLDDAREFYKV